MCRPLLFALSFVPVLVTASPLSVTALWVQNPACSQPTGAIDITVTGGTAPYTYAWNNFEVTEDIVGLGPGYYEVTVTDAMSQQATQGWTLVATQLSGGSNAQDGHASCIGQSGGEVQVIEWGTNGTPPYTYDPAPAGVDPQGDPFFYFPGVPFGTQVSINVTDADGCTGVVYEVITGPQPIGGPLMVLQSVQGSCSGGGGGSATITNVYDGVFLSGPDVTLFDPFDQGTPYGTAFSNTITFTDLGPGHYYVSRNWDPSNYIMAFPCEPNDTLGFDIPDLGVACGTASGTVFIDNDQDCTQDGGEVSVPELVLEVDPGGSYVLTDASGHYSIDLVDGSYTLAQNDASLVQLCPVAVPVPFTMAGNAQIIDLADSSTVPLDLKAYISGSAAHPGMAVTYAIKARNLSPQVSGPVTMTLGYDASLIFLSASIAPTSSVGNTLSWDLPALTAYAQQTINVQFQVPVGAPLGSQIFGSAGVTNSLPDANVLNNGAMLNTTVTGAFDPNEKVVQPADIFFLDIDDHLSYVIRFQNTGTDTAHNVVVTDTLSADLDMGSFQQGASSFPCTVEFLGGRVVRWTFTDILLPDSGTNEAASHGFTGFDIKPAAGLVGGTYIDNASDIYFDFNDPVRTNTASVLAEFSVSVQGYEQEPLSVFPNPAKDRLTVRCTRETIRAAVLTMDGRMVLAKATRGKTIELDIAQLASGSYVLEVAAADGHVRHQRFIKQ